MNIQSFDIRGDVASLENVDAFSKGKGSLRDDPRIRTIEWRDLLNLTSGQKFRELFLSLPWLILSLLFFHLGWIPFGFATAFFFFLTGLRQTHGAQHYSLGLSRRVQDLLLSTLSLLMISSLHALQATHIHHHQHTLEDSDVESMTARMPWWKALLTGPWFILQLNCRGYQLAKPHKKVWILGEWGGILVWIGTIFFSGIIALKLFALAMVVGECLTGFFAVWTVHHDCDREEEIARTQRGWWKNLISYEMFYHTEHHLFPAVPTPKLPELAARIDKVLPRIKRKQVF